MLGKFKTHSAILPLFHQSEGTLTVLFCLSLTGLRRAYSLDDINGRIRAV